MKLAFEDRLEYLAHNLAFHERRVRDLEFETSRAPGDADCPLTWSELLTQLADHKRQVKWFKAKLAQPFRASPSEEMAVLRNEALQPNNELSQPQYLTLDPVYVKERITQDNDLIKNTPFLKSVAPKPTFGQRCKSLWAKLKREK